MVSPRYSAEDWFRLQLERESDWPKAVDILQDRLNGRFIRFIDLIVNEDTSGFAVLALDVALVETLQQFREGLLSTPRGGGKAIFIRFLTETAFGESFTTELAGKFYTDIRNGLLHQAETRELTRVRRDGATIVMTGRDGFGMTVHPVLFHNKLKQVFAEYCQKLCDPSETTLRAAFQRKMDAICNVRLARAHVHLY